MKAYNLQLFCCFSFRSPTWPFPWPTLTLSTFLRTTILSTLPSLGKSIQSAIRRRFDVGRAPTVLRWSSRRRGTSFLCCAPSIGPSKSLESLWLSFSLFSFEFRWLLDRKKNHESNYVWQSVLLSSLSAINWKIKSDSPLKPKQTKLDETAAWLLNCSLSFLSLSTASFINLSFCSFSEQNSKLFFISVYMLIAYRLSNCKFCFLFLSLFSTGFFIVFFSCKLSDSLLSSFFSFSSFPSACFVVISNWFAKRKNR